MNVYELLEERKAIMHGHFLLASGNHSDTYVQCQKAFTYPQDTILVAEELIKTAKGICDIEALDAVVAPALGALVVGYEVARQLQKPFLFAERENGKLTFRRGFAIGPHKRYLTVEDVFTTGSSTMELINLVKAGGGVVDGAVAVVQRQKEITLPVPHASLVLLNLPIYEPEACPLCERHVPLEKPGTKQNMQDPL
ncbi:orotate phosphoribosyltransferase [Coprothermobacter platensis]|uniref:orotate phosphoribosyltransferase n=1 Tax=Coprothermobacter platensis TaxID=108819 RepID=UPI00035EA134|nr:orotate phosphoribosyltransferase [Coprothermobacter platensis]